MLEGKKNILFVIKSVYNLSVANEIISTQIKKSNISLLIDKSISNFSILKSNYSCIYFTHEYDISEISIIGQYFEEIFITDIDFPLNNYLFFRKYRTRQVNIYSDGSISLKINSIKEKIFNFIRKIFKACYYLIKYKFLYIPYYGYDDARYSNRVSAYYISSLFKDFVPDNKKHIFFPYVTLDLTKNLKSEYALFLLTNFNRATIDKSQVLIYIEEGIRKFILKYPTIKYLIIKPHLYYPELSGKIFLQGVTIINENPKKPVEEIINNYNPKYIVGYDSTWLCVNSQMDHRYVVISLIDNFFIYNLFDKVYFNSNMLNSFKKIGVNFINI